MLDIKRIREDRAVVLERLARRGEPEIPGLIHQALELDEKRRARVVDVDALRKKRNEISPLVGHLKKAGRHEEAEEHVEEVRAVNQQLATLDAELGQVAEALRDTLLQIPNMPAEEVPAGDVDANQIVDQWGEKPVFDFVPRPHWELGAELGILDLPRGAKVAGSGFPVLVGAGARLERALINFMMDLHAEEHGYTEIWPPFLINRQAALGTGHLPKFGHDMYDVPADGLYLVPTAEVPVTNLHAEELLPADALPIRYVAYTPCFRREAGAHGKDTRGLIRIHQFDKVELVRFERTEDGPDALESLTGHAEEALRRLGLPYRRVLLAAGDLGFANSKTYDLELWAPGVERWLEVSSCSHYGDYQARRANIRYRRQSDGRPEFAHTLNGSALALARTVVALLEVNQLEDGSVRVPEPLAGYFGADRIAPP